MSLIELIRSVRLCIDDYPVDSAAFESQTPTVSRNSYAGAPAMEGLGRFYQFDVRCVGCIDSATGYFLNIAVIDRVFRESLAARIGQLCRERSTASPVCMIGDLLSILTSALETHFETSGGSVPIGTISALRWRLTPTFSVEAVLNRELIEERLGMKPQTSFGVAVRGEQFSCVLFRQKFDFAAAHRLHVDSLSPEQNQMLFGKCNNPRGHGHNYQVEPCIEIDQDFASFPRDIHASIERITATAIIDRFDHKHLNEDVVEFDQRRGGLNPSVENIALVCYRLLEPEIARLDMQGRVRLRSVTVWETEKTSATYPAF